MLKPPWAMMLRLRLPSIRATFICALVALCSSVLWAADSKQAEAQALFDKAEQLSLLTQKGSPPFTLEATIEVGDGKQKKTANFYFLWLDAEHWRAIAVEGDHREVHVRDPEGLWQPKLPDPALMQTFRYGETFPFKRSLISEDDGKVASVQERTVNGTLLSCVLLRGDQTERELCFNSATSLLERVSHRATGPVTAGLFQFAFPETVLEYKDYVKFGERWVPQQIRWITNGHLQIEVHVLELGANPQTATDLFSHDAQYEVWPDCAHFSNARPLHVVHIIISAQMAEAEKAGLDDPGNPVDLFFPAEAILVVVSAAGKAQEVRLLNLSGGNAKSFAKWPVNWLMKMRYRPAICDGKPVLGYYALGPPRAPR